MRKSASSRLCGFGLAVLAGGAGGCDRDPRTPPPAPTLEVPRLRGGVGAELEGAPRGVVFSRAPARVGQRFRVHVAAESRWSDPQQGLETTVYDSEYEVEVLAVEGPAASSVRISFTRNVNIELGQPAETPIHGKSYLVGVRAPLVVDATTGLPPTADELARVTDVLPDLGARSQIDQVLSDGSMEPGEHRDEVALAITRILHPRHWQHERGAAVLVRADAKAATFEIVIEAKSSLSSMVMRLVGEAQVRLADARLEGFVLRGTFSRASGEEGSIAVTRTVRDL